ncbi:MAG TPA: hypothetical protein DCX14_14295 [Flavobacteriales bacterium]|jgi:hypothetical protein|nr:hypothetical protein [Flavobacteriales bacterium]HAW21348.1 hypothetical protein [Flavobacteriales bacterium]
MKHSLFLIGCTIALVIAGCNKPTDTFGKNENTVIPFGKSATFEDGKTNFEIEFLTLVEESRCPPNSICAWEGRAIIELKIDEDTKLELGNGNLLSGTQLRVPFQAYYDDFLITLVKVDYGADANYGTAEKYSVEIIIE